MENNNLPSDDNLLDAKDYAALKALHTSTSGRRWKNKTGWNFTSETPPPAEAVSDWHGVTVVGDRANCWQFCRELLRINLIQLIL
ncbi:MAG: hypothetical protein EBE86_016810 [Hormoscilla sp. GUM202]|nr:hypothetical protein [Hormoscilla sp. GUM202]